MSDEALRDAEGSSNRSCVLNVRNTWKDPVTRLGSPNLTKTPRSCTDTFNAAVTAGKILDILVQRIQMKFLTILQALDQPARKFAAVLGDVEMLGLSGVRQVGRLVSGKYIHEKCLFRGFYSELLFVDSTMAQFIVLQRHFTLSFSRTTKRPHIS